MMFFELLRREGQQLLNIVANLPKPGIFCFLLALHTKSPQISAP